MRIFSLLLPALAFLAGGCATTFSPRELASLRARGVPPPTMLRIENGTPLSPPDLITLTLRGVPQSMIVQYLEDVGVDYLLTRADLGRLRNAGVRARTMDAVLGECAKFADEYAVAPYDLSYGFGLGSGPYFGPDLYYDAW